MARIFVSHSSRDQKQAAQLLDWLHGQGFVSTFLDFDKDAGLAPGADWERTLYQELSNADAVILILTKNWFDSKWCFVEFAQARALGKAIFPLLEAPTGETFVSSDIQHLDLVKDREGGLERLRAELTRIAVNTRGGFPWEATRPPFPGLFAFDEADAAVYFGRDDDIRRLIERLNARRAQGGEKLVALLGASGAGKSSLLRAGVVPRLKRDPHNWIVLPPFRPQMHPLDELAQAVATGLDDAAKWRQWRTAFESNDATGAVAELARDLRAAHKENEAHILLVIDQGEELFSGADAKEAEQFFRVLNALLDERLPFLAVMALRSDYLGKLQEAHELAVQFEQFSLKPMPLERVREVIEGPAKAAGIAVDGALVTAAVADARTDDALPLLAFALRELYDRSSKSGRLTVEAYRALGDATGDLSPLENAVRKKADEVLGAAKPSPEDLQALKEAFIPAMVRVNADGEYVRRSANMAAFGGRALPLLERLAKARLLTIHKEQNATLVEVAHEALLRKWPLLRDWLDEEREFLIGKDQLEADLLDWEAAPREQKDETLLTGLKLTRARGWLAGKPLQLSEAERKFIQASIARHDAEAAHREQARRRVVEWSVAAAAVLAVVAAYALWEWHEAGIRENQATSRTLAMEAVQNIGTDLGLALQKAVNAGERSNTDEANFALHVVLEAPQERFILHHQGPVLRAAYSPDGSRMVTASADKTARIWDAQSGRLVATLSGHSDIVGSAVVSPDGKQIATTSLDHTARIWDAASGRLLVTLSGDTDRVVSAAFSPDGKHIATSSYDHTARIWDAASGRLLATLSGHTDKVISAIFSPDGTRIVTASYDHTARVWDATNGSLLATLSGHTDEVTTAVFSPDGKKIATASVDKTARVWDAESGHLLATLSGHSDRINAAAFSPDGTKIVTASTDKTAGIWDAESGHLLVPLIGHGGAVYTAAFSPDGKRVVTASYDYTARIWDAGTGQLEATLFGHSGAVYSAVFSPDGRSIVTAGFDNTARSWETDRGDLVATLRGHTGAIESAAYSPDGKQIATASLDHTARIWDAVSGRPLVTLSGHSNNVLSVAFSPDGKHVVTTSADTTARIWDAASGKLVATLSGHTALVYSAVYSLDGKEIATASQDKTARVWDAENGRLLATLSGDTDQVVNAVFSPDGRRVATASYDHTARIWDAASGRLLATLSRDTDVVNSAEFSPDGKYIVTASSDGSARIWDAESAKLLNTLSGHTSIVIDAEYSPDGKRIVTASFDDTARIWDAQSGRMLAILSGHTSDVLSAAYSPDGKCIVTASTDDTARVWDAEGGGLLATLPGQKGAIYAASFSPDNKRIVTGGDDGTGKIYIGDFAELLDKAKQRLPIDSGN